MELVHKCAFKSCSGSCPDDADAIDHTSPTQVPLGPWADDHDPSEKVDDETKIGVL